MRNRLSSQYDHHCIPVISLSCRSTDSLALLFVVWLAGWPPSRATAAAAAPDISAVPEAAGTESSNSTRVLRFHHHSAIIPQHKTIAAEPPLQHTSHLLARSLPPTAPLPILNKSIMPLALREVYNAVGEEKLLEMCEKFYDRVYGTRDCTPSQPMGTDVNGVR